MLDFYPQMMMANFLQSMAYIRNKFGKQLLVTQLARNIFNTVSPIKPLGMKGIPLPWNRSIENPQETNSVDC